MANPQTQNGYTRIANELMEALCRVNLSSYESRIVWFVIRKTYGFNKKMDRIPLSQFAVGTGLPPRNARRAVKSLLDRNILVAEKPKPYSVLYGFQKDYGRWLKPLSVQTVSIETVSEQTVSLEVQTSVGTDREISVGRDRLKRKKDNTKDNGAADAAFEGETDFTLKTFQDETHFPQTLKPISPNPSLNRQKNNKEPGSDEPIPNFSFPPENQREGAGKNNGAADAAFEKAWLLYPKRAGGNSKKSACAKWTARVRAGVDPNEMMAGVERYAKYIRATGKEGSEYVKQTEVFFGPGEHWREDWEIPDRVERQHNGGFVG